MEADDDGALDESPEYEASVVDDAEVETPTFASDSHAPAFRAIDLISTDRVFRRMPADDLNHDADDPDCQVSDFKEDGTQAASEADWEHVGLEPFQTEPFGGYLTPDVSQQVESECMTEESLQLVEDLGDAVEQVQDDAVTGPTVSRQAWSEIAASGFGQFRQVDNMLLFPWETGVLAEIFDLNQDPLPTCPGLPELALDTQVGTSSDMQVQLERFQMPHDAKYTHAVKSLQDMTYFEAKSQKLDLACAQWLNLLSIEWSASGVGPQLVVALQRDPSGVEAVTVLKSAFGVKSPSTLLKRASAFRKFVAWFDKTGMGGDSNLRPLPLDEEVVWAYFKWLKEQRQIAAKGFTVPSSFLEAVRFGKFTLDLVGTDSILCSRRLLGFAALEKQAMGPSRQAPGMELEHLKRLHEILKSDANNIDKLGAACFLICIYGRARWSDVRFVERVEIEEGETLTLYTAEHKTAAVGLRRQQFLPIVVPWNGVVTDDWMNVFLTLYACVGLDITKKPLGPLLPAPRLDGTFCARPLTTSEAADWLRALLNGTSNFESFRSHSMKATLLGWCARAGLDKESRAVLGHHCSALNGSEVVYSRQLQIRALRKLGHILRRVRAGQSLEDEAMRDYGLVRTPMPFTPVCAARTPGVQEVGQPPAEAAAAAAEVDTVKAAVEAAVEAEEIQSVKEEVLDEALLEKAAEDLTLFPVECVSAGVVEIESSSGSSSSSSSYESSSSDDSPVANRGRVVFTEHVPEGRDFFKHIKSGIVHSCKVGETVSVCKLNMGANFKLLARTFHFRHPKCLRCFPKDSDRIRSVEQLTDSLDGFLKRARSS
mmetsp:Transcript_28330/g.46610  ORF Transcript_28330/g.46610 Transcript_28330/m.46610 type:complete len:825 (+) Transcript_28330:1-2475(+)